MKQSAVRLIPIRKVIMWHRQTNIDSAWLHFSNQCLLFILGRYSRLSSTVFPDQTDLYAVQTVHPQLQNDPGEFWVASGRRAVTPCIGTYTASLRRGTGRTNKSLEMPACPVDTEAEAGCETLETGSQAF